jgi:hypothetical protein
MTGERFRPAVLCRILARRRALRQVRTKSELFACTLTPFMAYTSAVEFVWLPAATSPGPAPYRHCERSEAIHGPAAAPSAISRRLVRRRPEPQKQLTTQPVALSASRECLVERSIASLARNDGGTVPPGRLCRILARRRALRQSRTKSELLLARLRRSWHIRLQWNSCGCRRRLRPARPALKIIQILQSGPRPPRSSPSLVPRCREPQKAADYATSGASASRERLVKGCVAVLATTGGAVPPGFFCRILGSRRALRQARTKSEL